VRKSGGHFAEARLTSGITQPVRPVRHHVGVTAVPVQLGISLPNHAFEGTAASALRLLAVPSSLRSSAAPQRER